MKKRYHQLVEFLYGPFFKVIGFFYRIYKSNRGWVEALTGGEKASFLLRNATLVILVIWLLVWYFSPEGSSDRLTDEVKQTIEGIKNPSE